MISDETRTLATMIRHRAQVAFLLRELAREFERRADQHDLSKFELDEIEGFVEINRIAREHPYGSPEYNASIKDNKAVDLHYSRNSHHPEYHHLAGVNGMSFPDFVEMTMDWMAATKTYGTSKIEDVLVKQKKRFRLTDCQMAMIALIYDWFGMK